LQADHENHRPRRIHLIMAGSGCRTACGFLNLKPYSTAFCSMTVTHDESAVGLVETN